MDKNRRDHTRFLMIGFSASLVIGILFFALSAAATVRDTKKLIEEAEISRSDRRRQLRSDKHIFYQIKPLL